MKVKKILALLLCSILVIAGLSLVGLVFDEPDPGSEEYYSYQEDQQSDNPLLVVGALIGLVSAAAGVYGFYKQFK